MGVSRREWLGSSAALISVWAGCPGLLQAQEQPKLYPLASSSLVLDVTAAGDALIAVGDRGFILRSTDQGLSWSQVASPSRVMLTAVAMASPTVGFAVGHDTTILKTTDAGQSWSQIASDPQLESPFFDLSFVSPEKGFVVGAYGLIHETIDGGQSWRERKISDDEPHLYGIAHRGRYVFTAGEAGALFFSGDNGGTWTQLAASPYDGSYFGILALKDGGLLLHGLRGNLFRSDDAGESWTKIDTGTQASLQGAVQRQDGKVIVVGLSGTVLTSADGRAFKLQSLPDREALSGIFETPAGQLIIYGEKGVRRFDPAKAPGA